IRSFFFEKKGPFYLNGERLLLRGTHRHEDHAGVAQAMSDEQIREEFRLMKEMGVNFIRLGHYQQPELVLDLCDSLGILVWEEIPWCRAGADSEGQKQERDAALRNLIAQHYNHPSIIIWGLGNEHDWRGEREKLDTVAIRTHLAYLHSLSHCLDDQRMTAIRRCDFAKDIIDVYSPSIWAGWYRGIFTEYQNVSRQEMEEVDRFLHVEWGASHHGFRHSESPDQGIEAIGRVGSADEREGDFLLTGGDPRVSKDGDWSTTYACNLIDWHLKEQENMPWLTGTAYWPFKDFSTPLRSENPIPYVNQKGVLERDFSKKESYYVFQSYWTEHAMIHIYGSTWDTRWGAEGETKLVKVYSNCTEVELWVNGVSQGTKKRNSQDYPAAGLRWPVSFDAGQNTLIAKGKKAGQVRADTISLRYQTQVWGTPQQFTLEVAERQGDSVLVEASLLDAKGVLCLDARDFVEFGIAGAGELLDNQGTSVGSRRIGLANGKARIWVQKHPGPLVVSVRLVPDVGKDAPRAEVSVELLEIEP
ncbi:MAG: glycoside hydrolase family 2 TIM barrel-domain containing protein, partial [Bacteroidota bacterium]